MPAALSALYPILDARFLSADPKSRNAFLARIAVEFHAAGVTLLQLREKATPREQILDDAVTLRRAAPTGLRLILNDDSELAAAAGFDGVHLGQTDMAVAAARALLGPGKLVGLSTHSSAQISTADFTVADYLAIGPVFATTTKADAEPVVGLAGVRAARALTRKPLVAIGGITLENAASVREAGADAIAVIGALFADPIRSPAKLAEDFLRRLR